MLSYFPPTDEAMAVIQLNEPIKVIKKLKKNGTLNYIGKLICNKSINEYLKGGKGYKDSLRLSLEKTINTVIDDRYTSMKFQSKAIIQLDKLVAKGFITVTFKSKTETSLQNLFMIKRVEWTDEVHVAMNTLFNTIEKDIIKKVAYDYVYTNFDDRVDINKPLKQLQEYGLVHLFSNILSERIETKLAEQQVIVTQFQTLKKSEQKIIQDINDIQKSIAYNKYQISMSNGVALYTKENEQLALNISHLKKEHQDRYDFYQEIATKLRIDNGIILLTKFKNKLLDKHQWGYSGFVEEFQSQNFQVNNQVLSLDDIAKLVNHTRNLYGKSTLKTNKEIIEELQNEISWDFNAH